MDLSEIMRRATYVVEAVEDLGEAEMRQALRIALAALDKSDLLDRAPLVEPVPDLNGPVHTVQIRGQKTTHIFDAESYPEVIKATEPEKPAGPYIFTEADVGKRVRTQYRTLGTIVEFRNRSTTSYPVVVLEDGSGDRLTYMVDGRYFILETTTSLYLVNPDEGN